MQASAKVLLVLFLANSAPPAVDAVAQQQRMKMEVAANPVRKVVTLLQKMQAEVTAEGKKEEDLYNKFMCYCKTSKGALATGIDAAKAKIASLESEMKADIEKKAQTEADLKKHQESRAAADDAISQATALREKENAAFKAESGDLSTNLAALAKAIPAIEGGMGSAFLQTGAANLIRKFAMEKANIPDMSRQELLSFLSGTEEQGYAPQSGEIVGILKQMQDEMAKNLKDATAEEASAASDYKELMAAKSKEVESLAGQIEVEMQRIGDLAVKNAASEHDLEDTKISLAEDEKFFADMEKSCGTKTGEWEEIKKMRAEELLALAETIKVLNDDDALEMFKKTLPSASASFMQVQVTSSQMKARALLEVKSAVATQRRARGSSRALPARPELELIALALSGKQQGFEKVIKMIEDMVVLLKKEQTDDDQKKKYCEAEFDTSDDKKKALELSISDSEASIEDLKGSIANILEEIASVTAGVKALDASVAEATVLRKTENEDYKEIMSNDSTAKEVLLFAKNRLNKFYNPKLYKAPPAQQLSEGDAIYVAEGGSVALVQISSDSQDEVAPPPPPETAGAYSKKGPQSSGVIAMIDLLVTDLDKEMAEAEVMEKDAQKEYEEMIADSAAKRAEDKKALTDKESAKAAAEEQLQALSGTAAGTKEELMATLEYIHGLHGECDWLVKYYDVRKEARTEEIESLGRATAVLSGADYSLVQTQSAHRHAMTGSFLGPRM